MKNETRNDKLIMNSAGEEDNMEEIQYPTDWELERMYAEFLKSESLHKFFEDEPF